MNVEFRVEKGLPVPTPWRERPALSPEEAKARKAAQARQIAQRHRDAGLCAFGTSVCSDRPAVGHTMCERHLEYMRAAAKKRSEEKKAKGLCRQCDRPAFAGMAYCLVHRAGVGLPNVVRRGLAEFRRLERESEEAEARASRNEHIRQRLHLLNDRLRLIVTLRNGLDGGRDRTLEEIGAQLGITRERVRQLEEKAMFKIEDGVPVPTKRDTQRAEVIETLVQMQPGQSFVCTPEQKHVVYNYAKLLGRVVTSRKQEDGQFRVWMVSKNGDSK